MNKCKKCNLEFHPVKGLINYCSLKCRNSRIFTENSCKLKSDANLGKVSSDFTKIKRQKTNIERYGVYHHNYKGDAAFENRICKVCNILFKIRISSPKKTCSRICRITASTSRTYRNGSRKTIYYNGIILESSWELEIAQLLDLLQIEWVRPKPMKWFDSSSKEHLYYPDFYLPKYNIYLDPKNPYCMERDKEKMEYIGRYIKLIYGPLDFIKQYISSMV